MELPRALIFDFNGTLSDDEVLTGEIYAEVFAAHGLTFSETDYQEHLLGCSDPEIIRGAYRLKNCQEAPGEWCAAVFAAKAERYLAATRDRPSISEQTIAFVETVAEFYPLAIASAALRPDIESGLRRAGISDLFDVIVAVEDVAQVKPHPEAFLRAAEALGFAPGECLAFEDSLPGLASARGAGVRLVGRRGSASEEALQGSCELVFTDFEDLALARLVGLL